MKDGGLLRAIEAAGGVGALARALGISQPSVSNWTRIPAERVIAVESLTGVQRTELRPDLYPSEPIILPASDIDEIDRARAMHYLLLAQLMRRAPDADLLSRLTNLKGDSSELGLALVGLAEAAERALPEPVAREFFALFIGVGKSEILPYGSYYLTGFLHERPLARVREDLAALGIERATGDFEPEDHLGTLFEVMAGLADGTFEAPAERQQFFFERHIKPWAARFFADLGTAPSADFYRAVARLGGQFVAIEADGFTFAS
jgi:TorA maturation chaperone TorD